jgi:hypothetical protein
MIIHEFEKNAIEKVQVAVNEFRGNDYFNIRIWFEDDGGEYKPSPKGITLNVDLLPELQKALKKAAAALEKR